MINNFKINSILLYTILFTGGQVRSIDKRRLPREIHLLEEVTKPFHLKISTKRNKTWPLKGCTEWGLK